MANENYWAAFASRYARRVSRRQFLKVGLGVTGATLAAACAPAAPGGGGAAPTSTAGGGAVSAEAPVKGGILRDNMYGNVVTFDPHKSISYLTHLPLDYLHVKLTHVDYSKTPPYQLGKGKVIGELAEKWDHTDDLKTWTFYLKKGIRFAKQEPVNGREIKADDVVYSYKRAFLPGMIRQDYAWYGIDPNGIEKIDDYTVRFHLSTPNALLHESVKGYANYILPKEVEQKFDGLDKMESAIGAGPWILQTYETNRRMVYRRNPDYNGLPGGVPYADNVDRLFFADAASQLAAFRGGEFDSFPVGRADLDSVKSTNPTLRWNDYYALTSTWYLGFNTQQKPFDDVRVRRAVSLAIDRDGIVKGFYQGDAKKESGPITWGYAADGWKLDIPDLGDGAQWMKYDPARAKQLLADAGFPNGLNTLINLTPQYGQDSINEAVLLQKWLADVGITAELKQWEYGQWINAQYVGKYDGLFWGPDNLDILMDQIVTRFGATNARNHSNVKDPKIEEMGKQWVATADVEKRKKLTHDMQRYMADQVYAVWDPQPQSHLAWYPYLKNFEGQSQVGYDWSRSAWLWLDPAPKRQITG